jgi:hypothetical protein
LGYEVIVVDHEESGRAYISKGFLKKQGLLIKNVNIFKGIVSAEIR